MKRLFLSVVAIVAFVATAVGQAIPADTAVRTGKLDNGMTYYVRSNAKPAKQAEFYILHHVGAIQEEDNQQGLAHFLEHMAFNGTKNLPDKMLINYLEKVGVKFGANLNAFTAQEQTCYNMSAVPLNREGIIDTCLLILHDWSHFISLEHEEIDNERGVIVEELRTRNDANWRLNEKTRPVMTNYSKYGERNIIGSIEGLKSFTYQDIKDFYNRWYRPDLQAVVVVGDFDADWMVEKIKKVMADIPAVENPEPKQVIKIAGNDEPMVCVATDPEMTSTRITMFIKHDPVPKEMNNTVQAFVANLAIEMIGSMLSNRLTDISQQPNAPFIAAGSGYGALTDYQDVMQAIAIARDGEVEKAFEALYAEVEKAQRFGFTMSELERERAEVLRSNEKGYDNRNDRRNGELVWKYLNAFRTNSPIPSAETEYELVKQIVPMLDLNSLNAMAKELFKQKDNVVIVTAPEKAEAPVPSNEDVLAIINKVRGAELKPYEDNVVKEPLIPEGTVLKGSPVVKTTTDKFGSTVWTLKNGIKVVVKQTDFKADELRISAKALGGTSLVAAEDIYTAALIDMTIEQSGIGKFKATDLQKQLAGKDVGFAFSMDDYTATGSGTCSPKDIETQLQLMWLYFNAPRWSEEDFGVLMDMLATQLKNVESNPMYTFQKEYNKTLYNNNPRRGMMGLAELEKVDFAKMPELFKTVYGNAADFTFTFVGNVDLDVLKPLVEKYIGSLPASSKKKDRKTWKDDGVRWWKGEIDNTFATKMSMPKTTISLTFNADVEINLENTISFSFLQQIMRQRYTTSIREERGGTYSVGCGGGFARRPVEAVRFIVQFDTNKDLAAELIEVVKDELKKMAEEGPTADEINTVKEYMIKQYLDNTKNNAAWVGNLTNLHIEGDDMFTDYKAIVENMSNEQIKAIAAKIINSGNSALVVMNPEE